MRRSELERTLRAAGRIGHEAEFFLIGSQAVHACCRRPPPEVLLSQECDIYPRNHPECSGRIADELGRRSAFARRHGYYADVVTPEIACLPDGWKRRLKPLQAGRVRALCLEIHDLVVSKLAAGRLKDLEFIASLMQAGLVVSKTIKRRIRAFPSGRDQPRLHARWKSILDDRGSRLRRTP